MELDLESFLNSHSTSESDDEFNSVPHRTIDEILNDSDSSASSSPTSVPDYRTADSRDETLSEKLSVADTRKSPELDDNRSLQSKSSTINRLRSGEFPRDSFWRVSSSRPLPSLFGGVKSNAKPGAALAAAAAASRSAPTPHATAIKSRRASSGSLQKVVVDGVDLGSVRGDDSEFVSDEMASLNGDLIESGLDINRSDEISGEVDWKNSVYQSVEVEANGKLAMNEGNLDTGYDTGSAPVFASSNTEIEEEIVFQVKEDLTSDGSINLLDTSSSGFNSNVDLQNETLSVDVGVDSGLNEGPTISSSNNVEITHKASMLPSEDKELQTDDLEKEMPNSKEDEENLVDDDPSLVSDDINELVEERIDQLESERISKRAEKKSKPSLKPLELAEELEKKQASTGLHLEEGAAAQPMRLEGVRRGSITLGFFDINANNTITRVISSQAFQRDHGSPQVLAVHSNYVAVGMSKGLIVVLPSKYSPYNVDNMDAKMLMLGLQGDRSHAPVTSICFNQQGDLLLAGYGDGHVTVWDVPRASTAKVITGEHTSPVVHTLFLGQDFQVTRQFKAVTGDSKGLVLLHSFSVVPLLNRFSIKTQCLLDGQKTGIVLSASPLLFDELSGVTMVTPQGNTTAPTSSIGSMMGGVVGGDTGWKLFNEGSSLAEEGVVIFVTHQTALVVRLTPTLEVYAQLSKPDGVREGSMPYTAWKSVTQSHSSSENAQLEATERVSLLAIAWDRKVQVARLVKSELKVYRKWSLEGAAIGVAWLDDQMLVVLTSVGQVCLFAKDGTMIHQTTFAIDSFRGDDLVAYHTNFINIFGNPEKAYHNCVAVRGASVYILGPLHLVISRLLPWKERILVLRKAGDWMGALNMAMTLYDGKAHGVIDLPRTLDAVQEAIMPYLVELLLAYVDEVFSYISVACCNQIGKMELPETTNSSGQSEIKEQFTRVGGVAVEFCVHIRRTDILFDEIFSKFVAVQHKDTFLELLEPYILKDMLGFLPPEIMQALVEHYSSKGWLQRVEQCVLHMDISSLDFNQVVRLCREHGLYGALVYLFNKGLDDFKAPLEELLAVLRNSEKGTATALGYRMLVYLKYSFSGLAFPPGHGALPLIRLPSLREELVQFLLEGSELVKSQAVSRTYLNLYYLLELDTEATLDVLRCALVEDETPKEGPMYDTAQTDMASKKGNNQMTECQNLLVQSTINALIHILDEEGSYQTNDSDSSNGISSFEEWPSKKDMGHIFEFIAYYVSCGRATISKNVLNQILVYLTSENNIPPRATNHIIEPFKQREKQLLSLLEELPQIDWDASYVLHLCEKAQFFQVCGLIHALRHQYITALDSYMKDQDDPVHAFSFINYTISQLSATECAAFRSEVTRRIPELCELSREGTFFLVIDYFNKEASDILYDLRSHPKSLFLYLKSVIEAHLMGTLDFSFLIKNYTLDIPNGRRGNYHSKGLEAYLKRISDFPKFLRNIPVDVTDEMIELYLELLCQYECDSVLKFLQTFENYRVEHCLRLCQEYGIIDAAAFLLERVGDVGSALLLSLSGLNNKFIELDTTVGSLISKSNSSGSSGWECYTAVSNMNEMNAIRGILHACIGLCQRNTPRLNSEESETLWFKLLDTFCEPFMESDNGETANEEISPVGMLKSLVSTEDEESCIIKWRISKSHGGVQIFRKIFSEFIKEIIEGMIGYVRLPTIMSKLLYDNGNQEFGDFKLTILGMLGTYGFERRILGTAKSLIEDDTFYTMSLLKKGASRGYAPRSLLCCVCNCLLSKDSPGSSIRLFNCGHATHLQCEFLENEASSRSSSSGCPVCVPKKSTQRQKIKSVLPENGLVNKNMSRPTHGTNVLHPHESDGLENFYALHPISRFQILNDLQKDQKATHIEHIPRLRLAPPAVYHEKVKKGTDYLMGGSTSGVAKVEKPSRNKKLRDLKTRGSSLRFPLKSNIFGKEKISKQ